VLGLKDIFHNEAYINLELQATRPTQTNTKTTLFTTARFTLSAIEVAMP